MFLSKPYRPIMTQITLLLLSSLVVMSGASLSSALPPIQDYFSDLSNAGFWVRMLVTTPALFIVISAPLAGALIDRFGRKKLLIAGIVLYGLSGTSGFFIRSISGLLAGRAGIGVAIAIIFTTTTALIADYYQGPARARFLGLQAGFMSLSAVVFHPIGGALADMGWNVIFLIYSAAFLFLPLAAIFLYEPSSELSVPEFSQANRQLKDAIPLVMLVGIYTLTFLGQIIFYTIPVQLPFYLQTLKAGSMAMIGLITSLGSLTMGLSGLVYGRIKKLFTYRAIVSLSFGLMAAGYLVLGISRTVGIVLIGLFISGFGLGLTTPNLVSWLVDLAPINMRGRALGNRLTFNFLGQFMSPILVQPLIKASGVPAAYLAAAGLGGLIVIINLVAKQGNGSK